MHTVRNRIASRTPYISAASGPALAPPKPAAQRASRQDLARLLRSGVPAKAPDKDAAPIADMPAHERAAVPETRPQQRRKPKGKKARKAAARKAAASAGVPRIASGGGGKHRAAAPVAHHLPTAAQADALVPVAAHPVADVESGVLLELCLQAEPALALLLPPRPEPLVVAHLPAAQADLFPARVLTSASVPELLVQTQAPPAEPEHALSDDAQAAPLPRSRALVPVRRQGLVDVIAFLLRDSGRRLARWSAQRHKSRAERDLIRSSEARQRALLSELEALDALLRNRG